MNRLTLLCGTALLCAQPSWSDSQTSGNPFAQDLSALSIEQLMHVQVTGAALHPQTLEEAPASVTIITAEDIRKYGYRTLGEALASVRGFYVNNDRTYTSVGVRGFNLPGDYASHLLVMVNGHNMVDNISNFMLYFGNDFPIDMNLIKQIEIIRGPASALYGSDAIFATINVVTKVPGEGAPLTMTTDTGSFGERKAQLAAAASLGGAKVLVSGSVFNNAGESPLYFPQFNAPATNFGNAIDMNGERGYHFFSSLAWKNWTLTAAFAGHDRIQPISWGPTIFNDRGTQNSDTRDFIDAAYRREIAGGALQWRIYYDSFHYLGRADFALADGSVEDNRSSLTGNWVGSEITYRLRPLPVVGDITVGADASMDLRASLKDNDVSPSPVEYVNVDRRDRALAFIVQDEKKLVKGWTLDLGVRVDRSAYRSDFVSPRAALIERHADWTYKFLYGRSFRNPSPFELYYGDGIGDAANPHARPEAANTVEVDIERRLGERWNMQASAYGYRLRDFLVGAYNADGLLEYQNSGEIHAEGIEFEISGRPASWLETTASYAVQRSRENTILQNSPEHLAKLRFAVPLGRKFDVSSGMQYESSRLTLAGGSINPVYLADFTLTTKHLLPNLDMRLGLRNAFNRSYTDPIALNPIVDSMPQPGRSFFVELITHQAR